MAVLPIGIAIRFLFQLVLARESQISQLSLDSLRIRCRLVSEDVIPVSVPSPAEVVGSFPSSRQYWDGISPAAMPQRIAL